MRPVRHFPVEEKDMATIIYRNRKRAYPVPKGREEAHDYFIGNPVSLWKDSADYKLAFVMIYGIDALRTALEFLTVPENRDQTCVTEPRFEIKVKSADPSPIPAPGTDPVLLEVLEILKKILQITQDLDARL